jgi:hypothetical protein
LEGGTGFITMWKREGSGEWVQIIHYTARVVTRGGINFDRGVFFPDYDRNGVSGYGIQYGQYMSKNQVWSLPGNLVFYHDNLRIYDEQTSFEILSGEEDEHYYQSAVHVKGIGSVTTTGGSDPPLGNAWVTGISGITITGAKAFDEQSYVRGIGSVSTASASSLIREGTAYVSGSYRLDIETIADYTRRKLFGGAVRRIFGGMIKKIFGDGF